MSEEERQQLQREIFGEDGKTFNKPAFDRYVARLKAEHEDEYFGKAIELWLAGWKSEPCRPDLQIMSWYWRRPPIGNRKHGRLFYSTDQAYRQMQRERQK